jgi:hypothetical protein
MDDIESILFVQRGNEISDIECNRCMRMNRFIKNTYFKNWKWYRVIKKPNLQRSVDHIKYFDATGCRLTPSVDDWRWEEKDVKIRHHSKARIRYLETKGGYFIQPMENFSYDDQELYHTLMRDKSTLDFVKDQDFNLISSEVPITFVEKVYCSSE